MKIVMIPSVGGGIGHISRTATLARMLQKIEPSVHVEYLLDTERLRPFNIEATKRMGFKPNLLPTLKRVSRESIVTNMLGDADIIIEDTSRNLIPIRHHLPRATWISIPLFPVADELFMDWPHLMQTDAILWAYAPFMGLPEELNVVSDKVLQTGPFLDLDDIPSRSGARETLKLDTDAEYVVWAPRGFPFGAAFGHRLLRGLYGAVAALRETTHPNLRLVLLAVAKTEEITSVEEMPAVLPDWVIPVGVVTPRESLLYTRAADIVIAEGTSTMHEGAALRTPLVLVPGTIPETWLLGTRFGEENAAHVRWIETVTPESMAETFHTVLQNEAAQQAMVEKAHGLVTGGGGVRAAAEAVLAAARERRTRLKLP